MVYTAIAISLLLETCRKNVLLEKEITEQSGSVMKNLKDKSSELLVQVDKAQLREAIKDARMTRLLDSLKIKPREVLSYKYIKTERTITDTLFEFELVECEDYPKVFVFNEKCFSATVDLTGGNPFIKANITNEIYDINSFKRKRLFNLKFTPRIGKKEFYQTLVSPCGDTIKNNQKIVYR
jgi:hypothetical protein